MLQLLKIIFITSFGLLSFSLEVFAVPASLSFQSKIYKPDGTALESNSVNFRFTTVDPTGTCILYIEDFPSVNMAGSSGLVIFNLGSGTKVYPTVAYTFTAVFNNLAPTFTCQGGGTYSPAMSGSDSRKIIAQFFDGSVNGWQTLPAIDVNSVPYSNYAGDSVKLAGFPAGDFLRYATLPICTGSDVLTATSSGAGTTLSCVPGAGAAAADATTSSKGIVQIGSGLNVASGIVSVANFDAAKITTGIISTARLGSGIPNATNYLRGDGTWVAVPTTGVTGVSSTNSYLSVANAATTPALTVNVGTIAGTLAAGDDSRFADSRAPNGSAAGDLTGNYPNPTLVNIVAASTNTKITYDAKGRVTAGANLAAVDIPNLDASKITTGALSAIVGGTGQTSYVIGDLLFASSMSALSRLPSSAGGLVLTSNGVGSAPSWQASASSLPAASGTAVAPGYAFSGDTNTGMFNAAADQIGFATAGVERVRVDVAGKVGIGTTVPTAVLNLKAGTVAANTAPLKFTSGPVLTAPEAGAVEYDGSNMYFTDSTAARRTIATTTTLGSYLPLAGGSMSGALLAADGTNAAPGISFASETNTGIHHPAAGIFMFDITGISQMQLSQLGGLEMSNVIRATSVTTALAPSFTFTGAANETTGIFNPSNAVFAIATSGAERLRVDAAGKVGIGTASPGAPLDVQATNTATNGSVVTIKIAPTYNQASGTAANTDLLINRTETAVGSGQQNLIDAQVGGASRFRVDNTGKVFADGSGLTGVAASTTPLSGLRAATGTNTIDNLNFAQVWNFSTAATQSPLSISANTLTTGSLLNLTSSSASLNSTYGLLNVANTSASTAGIVARIQSNSTAGSGMTVLANGNVGVGTIAPSNGGSAANASRTYLGISASAGPGVIQFSSNQADADDITQGNIEWVDNVTAQANRRVGYLNIVKSGTTSNNRGTYMAFATKDDNGTAAAERMRITNQGNLSLGTVGNTARLDVRGSTDDSSALTMAAKSLSGTNLFLVRNDGNVGIGTTTPGAALEVNGQVKITGGTPGSGRVLTSDAAGLASWLTPSTALPANAIAIYQVRVATTDNITLSALQTVDGVVLVAGDRVLVKNQGTARENGVYVVAAGAWVRATDMSTWLSTVGYTAQVSEGSVWAGMTFVSATAVGGVLGSTNIDWGAAGSTFTNTANGMQALYSNTSGSNNIANGFRALMSNMTGSNNIANGAYALQYNVAGNNNTANGVYALGTSEYSNGSNNTANGAYALQYNVAGNNNTANGTAALQYNTTGNNNSALGTYSGSAITTGSNNVVIGYNSGSAITTGSNNVVIGSNTGSTFATDSNNISINDGAGNERIRALANGNVGIGNTSPAKLLHVGSASVGTGLAVANFQNVDGTCTITPAAAGSGIACSSDERLKENFQDVSGSFALDRILKLQAVTYNFKTASTETRRTGYKAQEIQKIAPEFVRQNDDGYFQVYYDGLIPWITEAIKTMNTRVTELFKTSEGHSREIASVKAQAETEKAAKDKEIDKLKQENAAMKARLDKIEKMLNSK